MTYAQSDCRSGYDEPAMLATRIKKRPYSFVTWMAAMFLSCGAICSFGVGLRFYGVSKIIVLGNGQLFLWLGSYYPSPSEELSVYYPRQAPTSQLRRSFLSTLRLAFSIPRKEKDWNILPLGYPLVLLISTTSWLFWRCLSNPIGHCQSCGYNLQGNQSGKCPECGKPASSTF